MQLITNASDAGFAGFLLVVLRATAVMPALLLGMTLPLGYLMCVDVVLPVLALLLSITLPLGCLIDVLLAVLLSAIIGTAGQAVQAIL